MTNLTPSVSDPYTHFYSQLINNTHLSENIIDSPPSQMPQLESYVNSNIIIEEVLKDSKYITYNSDMEEKQCPISLEEFKDGDSLIELPCNHIFLENNINYWVKEKQTCPVCRHNLINVSSVNANSTGTQIESDEEIARRQWRITHQIDTMISYLTNQIRETDNVDTLDNIIEIAF